MSYLSVNHGNADPIVAPQSAAVGSKIKKFLKIVCIFYYNQLRDLSKVNPSYLHDELVSRMIDQITRSNCIVLCTLKIVKKNMKSPSPIESSMVLHDDDGLHNGIIGGAV
jgi:hypothetical protein